MSFKLSSMDLSTDPPCHTCMPAADGNTVSVYENLKCLKYVTAPVNRSREESSYALCGAAHLLRHSTDSMTVPVNDTVGELHECINHVCYTVITK
jgi:hypothetical protein